MLPTVGTDTSKIIWYASEVGGRTLGVAAMVNLVPDPERRAALEQAGKAIIAAAQQLAGQYTARLLFEFIDQRVTVGKGRGVDRGFDAGISAVSETVRTSLPDRNARNPEYRAIFPNGAEEFTSPTIKEDADLAASLHQSIKQSSLAVKAEVLAQLDLLLPVVGPAATAVREGEKAVNALFQSELNGRKQAIDTLWEQRKSIETALGRGGRGLARFIVFDFRNAGSQEATPEAPVAAPAVPAAPAVDDPGSK